MIPFHSTDRGPQKIALWLCRDGMAWSGGAQRAMISRGPKPLAAPLRLMQHSSQHCGNARPILALSLHCSLLNRLHWSPVASDVFCAEGKWPVSEGGQCFIECPSLPEGAAIFPPPRCRMPIGLCFLTLCLPSVTLTQTMGPQNPLSLHWLFFFFLNRECHRELWEIGLRAEKGSFFSAGLLGSSTFF